MTSDRPVSTNGGAPSAASSDHLAPATSSFRDDFPDFEGAAYLNAAFQGPMPRVALAALEAATRYKTHSHRFGDEVFYDIPDAYRADFLELIELLRQHKIRPIVAERLPLTDARRAHELLERSASVGKLVLVP